MSEEKENLEEIVEEETVETEELEVDELEETDEEKPLFLQEEEDEQESSDGVPVSTHVTMKQKLKGKIRESDAENERLRKKVEELERSATPQQIKPIVRPKLEDFDTDEEFDSAMGKYEHEHAQAIYQTVQNNERETENRDKFVKHIETSVDSHYDRAAKLVERHGMNPDVYKQAIDTVRSAVEEIIPSKGISAFDQFIALVGKGSEKTFYAIGRNKTKLSLLKEKLHEDPLGMKAAFFLGRETARLTEPTKKQSRAPKPTGQLQGSSGVKPGGKQRKEYDKLIDAGHSGKALTLMRQARKDGVDVKEWRK
jgi:hypothetical protein